jgi:hypothetical protein
VKQKGKWVVKLAEEKLAFSRQLLVFGNLALLAWVLLGFYGVFKINQLYGYVYVIFTAAVVYLILRRLGCSSCYLCKSCTSGFGRLTGSFFGRGFVRKASIGNRRGLVGFTYFLLVAVPVLALSFSLWHVFSIVDLLVLTCLLILAVYSLLGMRVTASRGDSGKVLNL